MSPRREFTKKVQAQIIIRATQNDVPCCEECGCQATRFQIDHTIPDGLVVEKKTLTPEDGKLLCIPCHKEKTVTDKGNIAKAVRLDQTRLGVKKRPSQPIPSAGFAPVDKQSKRTSESAKAAAAKRAPGATNLARRYGLA